MLAIFVGTEAGQKRASEAPLTFGNRQLENKYRQKEEETTEIHKMGKLLYSGVRILRTGSDIIITW